MHKIICLIVFFISIFLLFSNCKKNTNDSFSRQVADTISIIESSTQQNDSHCFHSGQYTFCAHQISQHTFDSLYAVYYKEYIPREIIDFEEARTTIDSLVLWYKNADTDEIQPIPLVITTRNGKTIELIAEDDFDSDILDMYSYFVAYFPDEAILLLEEGSHQHEDAYSLITGDSIQAIGNPRYTYFSPSKKYRIRGHYHGQGCMMYYYQKKQGDGYVNQVKIESDKTPSFNLCDMGKLFFVNDTVFYAATTRYCVDSKEEIPEFYKIEIHRSPN